ncbi:MAG TPA: TIGR01440 family protein [Chondromyces sp.]|nr:TIGR01440 family protein [Chondromyces sp.]
MLDINRWKEELSTILKEFQQQAQLKNGQILVIGCSTSEVAGERIGTSGTLEIAEMIYEVFSEFSQETGVFLVFQCCEHLNRALVIDRELLERERLEEVSVVPVRNAGGAMAAYAYAQKDHPVVVEYIKADAGIDIGDTFIGMHLKHVAVPMRVSLQSVGHAHVTMAKTRPKLIGGSRAVYESTNANEKCT